MSSVPDNAASVPPPAASGPSVFISYASEDRAAARVLRDTLAAAGLDVWYDEQELTGGDAWDQKIRRQIRDCEYFMPVISATTEARKEGYFRREWRLATERTLDMADDVLFIVPIVIDETQQAGARVPDKFLTVQWLRAPSGNATPALHHLIRRLLAGEHHLAMRPPSGATRAPFQRSPAPFPPPLTSEPPPLLPNEPDKSDAPPKMPPMPPVPEKGGFLHGIKFILEVCWWALTAAWMLFNRLPKWGRIVVSVWLVVMLFSFPRCSTGSGNRNNERDTAANRPPPPGRPPSGENSKTRSTDTTKKMRAFIDRITESAREGKITGDPDEISKLADHLSRGFSEGFSEIAATGKSLVVVPFGPPTAEDPGDRFAHAVFISLYGRISLEKRTDIGVAAPPKSELNDPALIARGKRLKAPFVLTASPSEKPPYQLHVRLLKVADGSVAWQDTYPVDDNDATNVAEQIHQKIFEHLPKREPKKDPEKDND